MGKLEAAEFFIFYERFLLNMGYSSFGGVFGGVFGNVTTKNTAEVAEYYVLMRGDEHEGGGYRPRILWSKQDLRVFRGNALFKSKLPSKDITRKFVKEAEKTRGSKK